MTPELALVEVLGRERGGAALLGASRLRELYEDGWRPTGSFFFSFLAREGGEKARKKKQDLVRQ